MLRYVTNTANLVIVPILACILAFAGNRPAHADFYKYTDKSGAVCIADKPDKVPPKYRATMKVIRDETLARKDRANRIETPRQAPSAPEAAAGPEAQQQAPPAEPQSDFGRLTARFPLLKPVLVAGGIIILFLIVRRVSAALPSPQLARLICIAFFLGVFVTIYVNYAKYVTENGIAFKKKILAMFEKANRREAPEPGAVPAPLPAGDRSEQ